ncbi:MAG TPA: aldo/keto reductase [Kofleriaceae bacterium]|nr:aldo/keto reductase [Kofleriaceae bacterium]
MESRRFGPLGDVPVIGLGTWKMEYDDRDAAISAIRRAVELGITHIDTAELYGSGRVETMVGEALDGVRDRVFLVSKVLPEHASYAGTLKACEASLKRLRTDHLDCYLLHWREDEPLAETFRAFETLKQQGKIRAWGVSNFDASDLEEAHAIVGDGVIACNQVLYHLADRGVEHRVIPWCEQHGVAVVAYSPFGSGNFPRSKALDDLARARGVTAYQLALRFLIRRPSTFAIPKSSNVDHVAQLAAAGDLTISDGDVAAIEKMFPRGSWKGLSMI